MEKDTQKKIIIAGFSGRYEIADIVASAKKLDIPLEVRRIDSMEQLKSVLEDSSVIYWRAGTLSRQFPDRLGRTTFLMQADRVVRVVNRMLIDAPHFIYKSIQQAHFQKHNSHTSHIRSIETYLAEKKEKLTALIASGHLCYPIIAKPNFGTRGNGVELLHSESDLGFFTDHNITNYIFQNFIPNKGDYRVLVVGGVAHEVMKRTPTDSSTKPYLNNISQGGRAERVPEGSMRTMLANAGCTAAAMFDYAICGVDFIEDSEGNLYFMEINSIPQWEGLATISKYPVGEHVVKALAAIGREIREEELVKAVHDYYMENLKFLSVSSQFHFLSRLYLWSREPFYFARLNDIRVEWWNRMDNIIERMRNMTYGEIKGRIGGRAYRRAAYKKHPCIDTYNNFFFKCLFDRTIFKGDAFDQLSVHISKEHLKKTYEDLINDPESVFTLSTPAVNFIYFCNLFFPDLCPPIDPKILLEWGETYRLADISADTDARIYFYTHAIINATEFYSKSIPSQHRYVYIEILRRIEHALSERYVHTSIDHKAEFIVCCRMLNFTSVLEPVISSEILASRARHGIYFQNVHNVKWNEFSRRSMQAVEHSNILALLAFMKFEDPMYPSPSQQFAIDGREVNT